MEVEPQAGAAPADLSGREIRIVPVEYGAMQFLKGSAYELRVGEDPIGSLRMSSAKKGFGALNEGEAVTDEGSWHLRRPVRKFRPHIDVTEVSGGARVAAYDSKVFGAGSVEIIGAGTFSRPGNPHRVKSRLETEAGEPVLELDATRLPAAEGTVRVGEAGIPRRDLVLLTVVVCFAYLLLARSSPVASGRRAAPTGD